MSHQCWLCSGLSGLENCSGWSAQEENGGLWAPVQANHHSGWTVKKSKTEKKISFLLWESSGYGSFLFPNHSSKCKIKLYPSCILEPNVEISAMLLVSQGNFKIQGARVTYDIYSMMLLLRDTTFRCETEEKVNIVYHQMMIAICFCFWGLGRPSLSFRNGAKWRVK